MTNEQDRELLEMAAKAAVWDCQFCIGTGIGNPHVERSVCSACNGTGLHRSERKFVDEDRWAWNHFEPESGDEDAAEIGRST